MFVVSPTTILYNASGVQLAVTPGSAIPVGTSAILTAGTDGTNARVLSVDATGRLDVIARITDGTNGPVAVQPASGKATASDPSLVVQISPNQEPIPTTIVPNDAVAGNAQGRTQSLAANTYAAIRATAYNEQTTGAQRSFSSASANDSAAGTGARQIKIYYLTSAGVGSGVPLQPFKTETITLNGTTPVNTVATDICFIEHIDVISAGSLGYNAGVITLRTATGGGGTVIGTIGTGNLVTGQGDNETLWAHHYVPTGYEVDVYSVVGAASTALGGGNSIQQLRGKPLVTANAVETLVGDLITISQGNSFERTFPAPLKFTGPYRLVLYGTVISNNTVMYASFDFSDHPI